MKVTNIIFRGLKCLNDRGFKYTFCRGIQYLYNFTNVENILSNKKIDTTNKKNKEYIEFLWKCERERYSNERPDFVDISTNDYVREKNSPKIIAWYLPQFYQMEVNNKYHGQGFTEWSNSSHTMPMFTGHYQPHIPYDVGYYDLMNPKTLERQAFLANKYGIYGFCFHWYWFSGIRTMEEPLKILLNNPNINIHYCFDWATENWTSAWDGGTKEVIFEQCIKDGDAKKLFDDLLPFFKDKRYIKIDNKPILSIYRCDMFDKKIFLKFISELRLLAKENGFPDLYIMLTNRVFEGDVTEWGLDALVEFPPCCLYGYTYRPNELDVYTSPNLKADFFDVKPFIENKLYLRNYGSEEYYRSALVGFDNSARRATTGCQIILNNTPEAFESWIKDLLLESKYIHNTENNIVFINSWNEWAEGSHLEPDMKYGYAYLQAVKNALETYDAFNTKYVENKLHNIVGNPHFYINCIESMGDIIASEPIVRYLHSLNNNASISWIVKRQYEDIVKYNPLIKEVITVNCLNEADIICEKLNKDTNNIIIDCHYDGRICSNTKTIHHNTINPRVNEKTYLYFDSLLESFCLTAGIPKIDETPKFYLKEFAENDLELPNKYIVVHCKSAEQTKDWDNKKWNELVSELINLGFNIVEIGLDSIIRTKSKRYYDLTNIHDIQVIARIIKEADYFISIDSGFAHIANAFNVTSLVILGQYKNFQDYNVYTGNFKKGINLKLVNAKTGLAIHVEVDEVLDSFKDIIKK